MSSSSGVPFQLWDPVNVESSAAQALQGVVAYLGPVDFSKGTNDFVGIRLTGPSVGLGKNNGTVEGRAYFEAGSNSGLFVRYSSGKITNRKLTRLQELQLKRELGLSAMKSTPSSSVSKSTTNTTPLSKEKSSSNLTSANKDMKTPASSSDKSLRSTTQSETTNVSSKNFSRIEAMRRRREEATAAASARSTSAAETSQASKSANAAISATKGKTLRDSRQSLGDDDAESVSSAKSGGSSVASESVGKSSTSRNARLEELKAEREARVFRSGSGKAKTGSSIPPRSGSKSYRSPVSSVSHPRTPISVSSKKTLESKFASGAEQAVLEYKEKWQEADEELQRKEQEIQALMKELEAASAQNKAKTGELDAKTEEIQKLTTEIKKLEEAKQSTQPAEGQSELPDSDYDAVVAEKERLESKCDQLSGTVESLREELLASKDNSSDEVARLKSDLLSARSRALAVEKEIETIQEQAAAKSTNAAGFMKERAKMSSEISALHRRIAELEAGEVDHDTMMEDVALDKEALQEEKEELQDKLQEMEMEVASLQVELEEVKVELDETKLALEDARQSAASAAVVAASGEITAQEGDVVSSTAADAQDVCRALATQNGRLREALVRLREQSNFEKIQLTKQVREAEKDAASGRELTSEVEKLREAKASMSNEIRELKEMVDTNAIFETIVEELSDKITNLEDENIELRNAVRDMEEAGEMAEEMEEVQGEEIKSLRRDVESRDTTIRNLEEAIKVQRRRELDLQRAVGNYRTVIDTLKQEKASLLELREEGEGKRNQLIAASQRALGQAAQLVSEQEARRKREAVAAFDKVNAQIGSYLALRMENLMPGTAEISTEIAATKGELLLSKVMMKGSLALSTLREQFAKSIASVGEVSLRPSVEFENLKEGELASVHLDDETFQKIENLVFEGKCCEAIIGASSECAALLLSNQWPGAMAIEDSREVGAAATGPASAVDNEVSTLLRSLNEEGQLSPHRSSVASLVQCTNDMKQNLIDSSGKSFVSEAIRNNHCLRILKNATCTKFAVQAAVAAFAEATNYLRNGDDKDVSTPLYLVTEKAERALKEMDRIMLVLATSSFSNDKASLAGAADCAKECSDYAGVFLSSIQNMFTDEKIIISSINESEHAAEELLKVIVQLLTLLKDAGLVGKEVPSLHNLSPEHSDPWQGLSDTAKSELGEAGILVFERRAQKVEQVIANAFESEGNLSLFKAKAESLEKTLATRSQEIAMQTVRMVELEKLLAQLSENDPKKTSPEKSKAEAASLESLAKLTEENHVLTEALDVLHAQVDEYEAEIRTLKEAGGKSVSRRAMFTPKGKGASSSDLGSTLSLLGKEASFANMNSTSAANEASVLKMEASLFRPALAEANNEAAAWRGKSMSQTLGLLKPLNVPGVPVKFASVGSTSRGQPQEGVAPKRRGELKQSSSNIKRISEELIVASMQWRMSKASTKLVSIKTEEGTSKSTTSRQRLRAKQSDESKVNKRVDSALSCARQCFMKFTGEIEMGEGPWVSPSLAASPRGYLSGVVAISGVSAEKVVPVDVNHNDLSKLHSMLLQ